MCYYLNTECSHVCHIMMRSLILVFLTNIVIRAIIAAHSLHVYSVMLTSGTTDTLQNPIDVFTQYN